VPAILDGPRPPAQRPIRQWWQRSFLSASRKLYYAEIRLRVLPKWADRTAHHPVDSLVHSGSSPLLFARIATFLSHWLDRAHLEVCNMWIGEDRIPPLLAPCALTARLVSSAISHATLAVRSTTPPTISGTPVGKYICRHSECGSSSPRGEIRHRVHVRRQAKNTASPTRQGAPNPSTQQSSVQEASARGQTHA
jgi:hypothetical protein